MTYFEILTLPCHYITAMFPDIQSLTPTFPSYSLPLMPFILCHQFSSTHFPTWFSPRFQLRVFPCFLTYINPPFINVVAGTILTLHSLSSNSQLSRQFKLELYFIGTQMCVLWQWFLFQHRNFRLPCSADALIDGTELLHHGADIVFMHSYTDSS
jgi:hypothetical protein